MPISLKGPIHSSEKVEQEKPATGRALENIVDQGPKFGNVLAEESAQPTMQPSAPSVPVGSGAMATKQSPMTSKYGFAAGPGYGSGIGTAGYGGDSCGSAENVLRPTETSVKKYALAQGPGYGSGIGTAGNGSDSCGDAGNALQPTETSVKECGLAQGPGYGSGIGTAGYGSDS
jgi:hypothetical protein